MHDMGVTLDGEAFNHLNGTGLRHSPHIVATEINQHQMLGDFLRICSQLFLESQIFFLGVTATAGAR